MDAPIGQPRQVLEWSVAIALGLATAALYASCVGNQFVNFDDHVYVTNNSTVQRGLSIDGVGWAFSSFVAGNWHPLTMLSHMADCSIWGLDPRGHHLTSVVIHSLNSAILVLVLGRMTGCLWKSALVGALFAWHPLHVESVAWIAERKDVLSSLFGLLAIGGYAAYARRGRLTRWLLVTALHAASLLCKPMLITLPFVLLLLDYWPLGRIAIKSHDNAPHRSRPIGLVLEKLPWLAISGMVGAITLIAQARANTVHPLDVLPLGERLANAAVAYLAYLEMTIWPSRLTVLYPLDPERLTMWRIGLAMAILALVSFLAVAQARRRPYLFVGWFWYLGTLVPVIGLIQVGRQATADRYTYWPLIGVFVVVAWGLCEVATRFPWTKLPIVAASLATLVGLAAMTRHQIGYWRDTTTLFSHAQQVTRNNYYAHFLLGNERLRAGDFDGALAHYNQALTIKPGFNHAHYNKGGVLLLHEGRYMEAAHSYQQALRFGYVRATTFTRLGECFLGAGDLRPAAAAFRRALEHGSANIDAVDGLARALAGMGRTDEAIDLLRDGVSRHPDAAVLAARLAWVYATARARSDAERAQAVRLAQRASRGEPEPSAFALDALAASYAAVGRFDEALRVAIEALQKARLEARSLAESRRLADELESRIELYRAGKPFRSSPLIAP